MASFGQGEAEGRYINRCSSLQREIKEERQIIFAS
jgi:hypothetical protein